MRECFLCHPNITELKVEYIKKILKLTGKVSGREKHSSMPSKVPAHMVENIDTTHKNHSMGVRAMLVKKKTKNTKILSGIIKCAKKCIILKKEVSLTYETYRNKLCVNIKYHLDIVVQTHAAHVINF